MTVTWLPPLHSEVQAEAAPIGEGHPHRALVEAALHGDRSAERELIERYAEMHSVWTEWAEAHQAYYTLALADALAAGAGVTLELSAGTGQASTLIAERCEFVVSLEPARPMVTELRERVGHTVVQAASELPFRVGSVDRVVGLNAVMLAREVRRVLRPGGEVVWAYSFAESTPVYIGPDELGAALGCPVTARRVGPGLWIRAVVS